MKKLILIISLLIININLYAFDVADSHIYNSRFWKNSLSVSTRPSYNLLVGASFDITKHDNFDHHIYAVRVPIALRLWEADFLLQPFFYPNSSNDASAYGGKIQFGGMIKMDEVEQITTDMYISAAFASHKADVSRGGAVTQDDTFYQMAYELGVKYNFFKTYGFDISGNVFQYPSGITDVDGVAGVMNQQELADLGTLDYVLDLPKFSGGLKMLWNSPGNKATSFLSYRYIDFHKQSAIQSAMISTTVMVYSTLYVSLSYNHLFIHGTDKDLFGGGIMFKF